MGRPCSTNGDMKNAHNFISENLKGRDHLEDLGVEEKIMFGRIIGK
jgi:hypothetical protein